MSAPEVLRVADAEAVARAAAGEVVRAAGEAVAARGRFTIALAGGSTPRRLHALLADPREPFRARVPWGAVHVFFGDERHVGPDDPESNHRMARETLLDHVAVASVHRIEGERPDAADAAARYEADLERFFGTRAERDAPPRLDLVLLGLGDDGHTASLFPGSDALGERRRWVAAPYVARLSAHRITLTLPALNRAREVLFLVSGAAKAAALAAVLSPAQGAPPLPAASVCPEGRPPRWVVDRAAAAGLR